MKFSVRLLVLLGCFTPLFSQESAAALVIFPYGALDPQVQEKYGYALYAVPDLLREKLELQGGLRFLDLPAPARTLGQKAEEEAGRLEAARTAGADYLIWGYLVSTQEGVKVVHRVAETREGTAVKVVSQNLPGGAGLIDAMDRSVLDFTSGLGQELPPLPPRIITVEKVVVREVPTPADSQGSAPPLPRSDFSLGTGLTAFTGSYAGTLAGALYLEAEITHPLNAEGTWDWGADLMIHGIKADADAKLEASQVPDLAYVPMLVKTSWRWSLGDFLHLGWGLKAGGALLFGTFGGEPLLLFRPAWATGPLVELWTDKSLGLRFQFDHLGTVLDWGKNYLGSLRLGLEFRFDV